LRAVQQELKRCDTFFEEQEEASSRLRSTAAAARESRCPIRSLHRHLLKQLHEVEEVSALTPDELVDELRYLQLAAMYGTEEEAAEEGADPLGRPSKKNKGLDDTVQEFLVQQLCAALAPKAAQSQRTFFPHDAAAAAPDGYLCPISREPMVNPVILEETGFSYEEAAIKRWLETNSSCPASGRQLSSKRLIPNINLKKGIQEWAAQNKVRLQAPPAHVPLIVVHPQDYDATPTTIRDQGSLGNDASGSMAGTSLGAAKSNPGATSTVNAAGIKLGPGSQAGSSSGSDCCRCTRTSWAVVLILLVVLASVGIGVGIHLVMKTRASSSSSSLAASTPTTPPAPAPPAAPEGAVPQHEGATVKYNNNGAVDCSTYCRGAQWGNVSYADCVAAYDTSVPGPKEIPCGKVPERDLGPELTCYCSNQATIKNNNDGSVDCLTYCRGAQWGNVSYTDCVAAYDTGVPGTKEIACGKVSERERGPELTCYCINQTQATSVMMDCQKKSNTIPAGEDPLNLMLGPGPGCKNFTPTTFPLERFELCYRPSGASDKNHGKVTQIRADWNPALIINSWFIGTMEQWNVDGFYSLVDGSDQACNGRVRTGQLFLRCSCSTSFEVSGTAFCTYKLQLWDKAFCT